MKKIIFAMFLLMLPLAMAFSFDDLFNLELNSLITGLNVHNVDPSVTLSRPIDTQAVNNPVTFKWNYFDPEDDEMNYFVLQIDDSPAFYSPINFYGVGEEYTVTLDEGGDYYWRVQVVNDFGSKLSDSWGFNLNPEMKVCDDGTPYFECSSNKPSYCYSGELREDCQRCGCSDNAVCQVDSSCLVLTCNDGTEYGECAFNKPFLCLNGELSEVCSLCGCDEGEECLNEGGCQDIVIEEEEEVVQKIIIPVDTGPSVFEKIVLFFKNLFG